VKPFARIRVARWGAYETATGPLRILKIDAAKIAARTEPRVDIDVEFLAGHQTTLALYFEATMGQAAIVAERDGLYAADIEWKAEALTLLEKDAYRWLVPAFEFTRLRRARRVIGLALTNSALAGMPTMRELLPEPLVVTAEASALALGGRVPLDRKRG